MFFKPTEVQNIQREKRDENGTIPASRKGVRNKQESLSGLRKNHCPESAGISVRFTQESLSGMARNHCPDWARICMQGVSCQKGGYCVEWDGQRVEPNEDGVLIISDTRSPYNGLSSADYYVLSKKWKRATSKLNNAKIKLTHELHAQGKSAEFDKRWKALRKKIIEKNEGYDKLFALKLPGKPAMPKWPEGCVNHLKEKNDVSQG